MNPAADLQPAYVLHTRPYRETSQIVDFITPEFGRVSAVARGVRRTKSRQQSLLQPFGRILVSWYGKGELKTLRGVEDQYARLTLKGDALFSGLYVNELLVKLLKEQDHCEGLFEAYEDLLHHLASESSIEPVLRAFEQRLLEELGYAIPFPDSNGDNGNLSSAAEPRDSIYYYATDGHFIRLSSPAQQEQLLRCFNGEDLNAIGKNDYRDPNILRSAKRLMRLALTPLLGGRALHSRELFKQQKGLGKD